MGEMSRALRDSASMSTVRVRASAQDVMGGVMEIVCVPEEDWIVREE